MFRRAGISVSQNDSVLGMYFKKIMLRRSSNNSRTRDTVVAGDKNRFFSIRQHTRACCLARIYTMSRPNVRKNGAFSLDHAFVRSPAKGVLVVNSSGYFLCTVAEARFIARNERHWIQLPVRHVGKRWRPGLLRNLQFYTLHPAQRSRKESRDLVVPVIASRILANNRAH